MKKCISMLAVLFLTIAMFTGCGCRNSRPAETSMPTTMPTTQATTAPTVPSTNTTQPTTEATIEDGNGPLSTDETLSTNTTTTTQPDTDNTPKG